MGSSASLLACSLLATGLTASSVVVLPSAAKAVEASAAVALTQPVAQSVPVSQEDAYVLGPGDGLQLRFFGATELSGPVEVLSDGNVSLPLLGPVRLTGLTLPQANQWLELIYKKQLLRPELQLSLVRPRPLRVALVGEVERPGLYTLTSTEQSQTEAKVSISGLPTLVDAIQKAGGITPLANLREVTLQRRLPGEPLRYKRTSVNLLALVQQGDQQQNPILFDGDTIRIDQASEPVAEAIELASTTLSPDTIKVNVIGEVLSPGTLPLPANTPLVQAVLAAGGPQTWRASKGNVELVRINRNGTATRQRFQLNLSQGASNTKNPPLRDGDTVVVNRSGMAVASDAIGAVSTPLTGLVSILALVDLINKD
nr:polysaccharide biosynthesis/export family protein [Cyanobium sp. Maggiore-St4-Cus]